MISYFCRVISSEEKEYVAKRQYDRIIEEQRKVDEQIGKQVGVYGGRLNTSLLFCPISFVTF